jgi:hypothetical protein
MTVPELEHAALTPYRWIELCAAFEKQHPNNSRAKLRARRTRIIKDMTWPDSRLFIVPGGRYLVTDSSNDISVWDLGYTSSADCKLIASVGWEVGFYSCMVQATPDGMGLIILSSHRYSNCTVYEIYPQSETPQLIQIAQLDFNPSMDLPAVLLPDRVIWYGFYDGRVVFRVWDFRGNYSISFSANVKQLGCNFEVMATKTAIIVLCGEGILVWAIPPLSPQPLDFFDHNPTHIPPLLRIPLPDGISPELISWQMISSWYFGSSQPLYFDILCLGSKLHRFKINVKPDLYDTSLHVINISDPLLVHEDNVYFQSYRICEDTLFVLWQGHAPRQCGVCTGLTSSRFANIISRGGPEFKLLLPGTGHANTLCPASGKFAHIDRRRRIIVVDFF